MGQNQNQIARRKKKGRPSKTDLANRPGFNESEAPKNDVRRSLRRRNVRYTLDYDDFFIDEFEEDEEQEEEDERRKREKKLKFLLQSKEDEPESTPIRTQRVNHTSSPVSPSSSDRIDGDDDDHEEVRCRTERKSYKEGDDSAPGTPERVDPLPDKKTLELILDKLQKKDIYGVYAEPVDPEELPDYHDVVEFPMDFATVRKKLANRTYVSLEQFESDVYLICTNAMLYNSADTIYHKQAKTIQEMAERKFKRLRMATERKRGSEKEEAKVFKKKKPLTTVNSNRNLQEAIVGSDFSSGATLATPPQPIFNSFDGNSFSIDGDDLLGIKANLSKCGKIPSLQDENRRTTYNQHITKSDSIITTFESQSKHLVAVGPHTDNSYARSLSRFAATLGPVAWKVASKRIEQALPPGSKYGPGWVNEYEPLPNPTIFHVENFSKKETVPMSDHRHHKVGSSLNRQMVKPEPENVQNQKKNHHHPLNVSVSTNAAAQVAARAWMSVGSSSSSIKNSHLPFQDFQEVQVQNRSSSPSMIFPQSMRPNLSWFQQVQSPRRQKQELLPPDLNISFQSSGSSPGRQSSTQQQQQQPDLALQL